MRLSPLLTLMLAACTCGMLPAVDAPKPNTAKQEQADRDSANQAEIQRLIIATEQQVREIETQLIANQAFKAGDAYLAAHNLLGQLTVLGADTSTNARLKKVSTRLVHLSAEVIEQMASAKSTASQP